MATCSLFMLLDGEFVKAYFWSILISIFLSNSQCMSFGVYVEVVVYYNNGNGQRVLLMSLPHCYVIGTHLITSLLHFVLESMLCWQYTNKWKYVPFLKK